MNIGLFTDTYFPQISGVSTSIQILKDELENKGHHVVLFTTTDPSALEEEENIVRLPSIPFASFQNRRIAYSGFDKCLRISRQHQLDIVHTHTEFSLGLIGRYVASKMQIPTIHTYHTMYENYTHYIWNGQLIQPKHVKIFSRLYCSQADGVIVPSKMTYDTLTDYGVEVPMRIIPTGVKIPEYVESNREIMREKLQIDEDEFVLLSLSRLSKEKSIDKLIATFPKIKAHISKVKLLIVGDGPSREKLEAQVEKLNIQADVYFLGEVSHDEVSQYYQMADLFVNASESESQGLTFNESIVNRLPFVAYRNVYLSSLIEHTPSFGRLVENDSELADTIISYIKAIQTNQLPAIDDEKLYPISGAYFANQVEQLYIKVLNHPDSVNKTMFKRVSTGVKELIRDIVVGGDNE